MSKNLIKNLLTRFNGDLYSIEEEVFLHIEELESTIEKQQVVIEAAKSYIDFNKKQYAYNKAHGHLKSVGY